MDTVERPDLLDRIRSETLHAIVCPHCQAELGHADAPLLVYTPSPRAGRAGEGSPSLRAGRAGEGSSSPRAGRAGVGGLLFSPAQHTTAEQDREHAAGLLDLLRTRLGDAWQGDWPPQNLAVVPQALLPVALADDPVAALRRMPPEVKAALERLRRENPEAFAWLEEATRAKLTEAEGDDGSATDGEWPEEMQILAEALKHISTDKRKALMELFASAENAKQLRQPWPNGLI
ncbi:MAG: CpXC domain-containing protein [Caldilineales bacterium]|nr:CpXC domain-containing protein [Caldilineales bacterium]